ncbi:MAG: hypothetical protein LBQ20_03760 [Rhodanobacter sp.]|nr:hypothetical protein [Rhodanobacter sp.]
MKTERLQLLVTPDFRDYLRAEAAAVGISVGELVRSRCETRPGKDEKLLAELTVELRTKVEEARRELRVGLDAVDSVLAELRAKRAARERTARGSVRVARPRARA